MSFRSKTILGIALIEAILLAALIFSVMGFLRDSNESQLQRHIITTTETFTSTVKDSLLGMDLARLQSFATQFVKNSDASYVRIDDSENHLLAAAGLPQLLARPFVADLSLMSVNDGIYDLRFPISVATTVFGRVEMGIDVSYLQNTFNSARKWSLFIAAIEMILVALFSFVLGTYLTRQLALLEEGSRRLASGQLGFQVKWRGNDELATTTRSFNMMSNQLLDDQRKQHEYEQQLIKARKAAEAAISAKSQFLSNMSHEIRTPMNGVLGIAEILAMPNMPEEERIECAQIILNSGNVLMNLLNDILDLSKIDADKLTVASKVMSPATIINDVQGLFSANIHKKGLQLESVWNGSAALYLSDPHRLTQMLSNLVGNAVKFTQKGYIRIEGREVRLDGKNATLEFSVIDTGAGITADKQALLFQPFSQVDASDTRNHDGAGLGLSIVRKLAELMGGEVGVESEVGKGSRFWFRVQVKRVTEI